MSSQVRPDGAAALLAGGPVRARRARRDVNCRRFVDKGQFIAGAKAVVVTGRGVLDHFAQQGAATEWYLRKIVVMPLSRRAPSLRLVPFSQTFVVCSHPTSEMLAGRCLALSGELWDLSKTPPTGSPGCVRRV